MACIKDDMLSFLSEKEIDKLVSELANKINSDFRESDEIILIAPLKGSILLASDLARKIIRPCSIEFVYLKSSSKGGTIYFEKDISSELRGKDVIIVEEIIDAGRKLYFLQNRILLSQPKSLKIATLLDKPARRELPIQPDYTGMTIEDRYVVGYGMDSDEYGRNYKDIYMLKN
jgi:hypoxanthine phosphoribosyltransferase